MEIIELPESQFRRMLELVEKSFGYLQEWMKEPQANHLCAARAHGCLDHLRDYMTMYAEKRDVFTAIGQTNRMTQHKEQE